MFFIIDKDIFFLDFLFWISFKREDFFNIWSSVVMKVLLVTGTIYAMAFSAVAIAKIDEMHEFLRSFRERISCFAHPTIVLGK